MVKQSIFKTDFHAKKIPYFLKSKFQPVNVAMMVPEIFPAMMTLENVLVEIMLLVINVHSVLLVSLDSQIVKVNKKSILKSKHYLLGLGTKVSISNSFAYFSKLNLA